jgi:FAD binding domain
LKNLKNPYYIGDQACLTETLGWVEAWSTQPSVYAVVARNAQDIAAAVNFARQNNLRLAIRGGGHSYQGTSNAPDSLLIWTRNMHDIEMHDAFVPRGCEQTLGPQPAVTVGAGTIGMQAYQAVTTKGGRYVQGGGCTTVCLGGLVQSGGFGSHSKRYGTAASNLLEAEVVTADGQIRIANSCTNPDLFWALKGGGGGTFGVVSKMTLRLHDLPEFFGTANFQINATSDDAYRQLIHEFVSFYRRNLFNQYWGEQALLWPNNTLQISMLSNGLDTNQAKQVWQPFIDWVKSTPGYSFRSPVVVASFPAQRYWDVKWNPALRLETGRAPRQKTHGGRETPYRLHGSYGVFSRYGCLLHFWRTTSKAISPTLYSLPPAILLSSCNSARDSPGRRQMRSRAPGTLPPIRPCSTPLRWR